MRESFSLNELYARYTGGLLGKKKFEGIIFRTILADRRHFNLHRWREDDCGDFVSWLYPRLSKAIDSYRYTGASFETYLGAVVRLSAREYRSRMTDKRIAEYASWTARFPAEYVSQIEPEYFEYESVSAPETPRPMDAARPGKPAAEKPAGDQIRPAGASAARSRWRKNPRQILFLILKCYCYVSDDFLDRIAPIAGIEKEYLKKMVDQMRTMRLKRDEELRWLRERIYCQFYRCIVYEKRLAAMPENSAISARMQSQLQRARQRLEAMRKRLAGIRPDATNRQIAELIGIAKGTVDASLHSLKARWNNGPNTSILN